MTIDEIISNIRAIGKWNSEHGFGNRGQRHPSDVAYELEKAYELCSMAYYTYQKWENTYMYFFIEKTMEMHPDLKTMYHHLWEPVYMGWDRSGKEFRRLYHICVEKNPDLKVAFEHLPTDYVKYGKNAKL